MWELKQGFEMICQHSTKIACLTEATELGFVVMMKGKKHLAEGFTITEIPAAYEATK